MYIFFLFQQAKQYLTLISSNYKIEFVYITVKGLKELLRMSTGPSIPVNRMTSTLGLHKDQLVRTFIMICVPIHAIYADLYRI